MLSDKSLDPTFLDEFKLTYSVVYYNNSLAGASVQMIRVYAIMRATPNTPIDQESYFQDNHQQPGSRALWQERRQRGDCSH